jgi:uncharacterized protein YajQ (UPF0234 family)
MPSFDIVSTVNMHEVANASDQANREIDNRFDFKGTGAKFELNNGAVVLTAQNTFQLQQMITILELKFSKRKIDIKCLKIDEPQENLHEAKQTITIRQGIDQELAKKIVKIIKNSKLKVQSAIQGEQIRVSGKKRDDLQNVISMLREEKLDMPLQYENFRD